MKESRSLAMLVLLLSIFYFLTTVEAILEGRTYNQYKVIRVDVPTKQDVEKVADYISKHNLDVWRRASVSMPSYDIMIYPSVSEEVMNAMTKLGVTYTTIIEDVQQLIEGQRQRRSKRGLRRRSFFRRYHPLHEIKKWMMNFARANNDTVKVVQVGSSYEGRAILALKIGVPDNGTTKRIIWQDGLIHAREWITGAALMWLSKQLVARYRREDAEVTRYLKQFDWYIVPVWNVDGYKFTWETDRMWRKSRSKGGSHGCYGVDLNRNFLTPNRGEGTASDNPCSEVYHGSSAFSEFESDSVRRFMTRKRDYLAAVVTLHSYAQHWLYPYGYTSEVSPDDEVLKRLSLKAVEAMERKRGTEYKQGTVSALAYPVSGGSMDWAYQKLCVKYSFGVELRDKGKFGFLLPPSYIIPTAEEYFEGVKVLARHLTHTRAEDQRSAYCVNSA